MAEKKNELLTAGNIAKALGVPGAKVKQAITALGLEPDVKKGGCSYYGKAALTRIKAAL